MPARTFIRHWLARAGLVVCSVLFTLVALEIALRLVAYQPPELLTAAVRRTYRVEPHGAFVYRGYLEGTFSDFATPVRMNSLGFHDVDHAAERSAPDQYRLMVIGDSYVAALSVPLNEAFYRRLEARLNATNPFGRSGYEVLAFGKSGQGQVEETEYVRRFGPVFRPDAVLLLFFGGNDVMENSPETYSAAGQFAERYKTEVAPRKLAFFNRVHLLRGSRLSARTAVAATSFYASHLHWFAEGLREEDLVSPELGVYRRPLTAEWKRAYDRTAQLLSALKREVHKLGASLLIAGLVGPQAIGEVSRQQMEAGDGAGIDLAQPDRWLARWCRANDVPYVSLEPALSAAGGRNVFWPHDGHLNVRGNEVIVDPLYHLVVDRAPR